MPGHSDAESGRCKPYRQILAEVITRVGEHLGCLPTREEHDTFSSSIVSWPEFPDSVPPVA